MDGVSCWRFGKHMLRWLALILGVCWTSGIAAAPLVQTPIVAPDAVSTPVALPNANHPAQTPLTYTVKPGDTLWRVALEMGLDLALMPCTVSPDFRPEQPLVIGNLLERLPPDQWCHTVQPGETLETIGVRYGVAPAQIYALPWNQLQRATVLNTQPLDEAPLGRLVQLQAGHHLRIPLTPVPAGAVRREPTPPTDTSSFLAWMLQQPVDTSPFAVLAVGGPFAEQMQRARRMQGAPADQALRPLNQPGVVPANWPYGSGAFTWPLAGWLTQGYRYDHRALDIAAPAGTPVTAADRGVVLRAGWNNQGYGLFVIIDHNIDYVTLYAHLSEVFVTEGQVVGQGEVIGKVGSTGNSTGPHLHFEIRDFGRLTNPLELLVQ